MRETTNLGVEIIKSKRQVKRKLGNVVQICVSVNVMLNLSTVSNSPIQDYIYQDDHIQNTYKMTPGFKPFTGPPE